jgi:hypothetical protein
MERFDSFEQFWPFYLGQHSNKTNRYLHFIGLCMAIPVIYLAFTLSWLWLLCLPVCGYGFAWIGHFVIEKNVPATFTYPVWSFMGDMKMFYLILTGKIDQEITRVVPTVN